MEKKKEYVVHLTAQYKDRTMRVPFKAPVAYISELLGGLIHVGYHSFEDIKIVEEEKKPLATYDICEAYKKSVSEKLV